MREQIFDILLSAKSNIGESYSKIVDDSWIEQDLISSVYPCLLWIVLKDDGNCKTKGNQCKYFEK